MAKCDSPFRWFDSSPGGDPLGGHDVCSVLLSLRKVEDLLFERGTDVCHETMRHWWNRFGPMFAGEIRKRPVKAMRQYTR
jgi:putative transposase